MSTDYPLHFCVGVCLCSVFKHIFQACLFSVEEEECRMFFCSASVSPEA